MAITVVSTTIPEKADAAETSLSEKTDVVETENVEESEIELADEAGEDEETEQQEQAKPKKKGGFQKKLERKDQRIAELESQLASKPPTKTESEKETVKVDDSKEPDIADYESVAKFTKDTAAWTVAQSKKADAEEKRQGEMQAEYKKLGDTYQSNLAAFKKSTPDFDNVLDGLSHIEMRDELGDAVITSDIAPEIMYHLGKNLELYEKINKMTPFQMAKEIGKLEVKLAKEEADESDVESETEVKENPKLTKAPTPIKTLSGKGQAVKKTIFNAGSQKEYEAARKQQQG